MSVFEQKKARVAQVVREAIEKARSEGAMSVKSIPEIYVEVPRDKDHGDFASNIAMVLASQARRAPRQIAEIIVDRLPLVGRGIKRVDIAGPGFINFYLDDSWLYDVVKTIEEQGSRFGHRVEGEGKKIQVEFVSANPTGPMNVVNARAAAVGDSLGNILAALGHDVFKEYYVNDAGRQAELFGHSLEVRCRQILGEDVAFPDEGYPGEYVREIARVMLAEHPDVMEKPAEERQAFLKKVGTDKMVERQRADLAAFGVQFDRWFRERDLHGSEAVDTAVEALRVGGHLYEEDGAVWFRSSAFGDDKDRVVIRSDERPTYLMADIAYHKNKFDRGFEKVIDIWGPDHHGYIGRMKAAVQALGYEADALEILILQLVTLLRSGRQVRMSKRAGEFITLQELLEDVGKDAARYFFLMRSLESHLDFDLDLAKEQSAENPVYYIQYAHARIASILRQAEAEGIEPDRTGEELAALTTEYELDLIRKLGEFPEELAQAGERREPNRVARYVHELASLFHTFYAHCRVLGEGADVEKARLRLIEAVQSVIRGCLDLLGIEAPERM